MPKGKHTHCTGLLWTTLSHAEYYHLHVHLHCICARGAPTILYMQLVYTTDPVKCLLIIVNVAVLVVKCCSQKGNLDCGQIEDCSPKN